MQRFILHYDATFWASAAASEQKQKMKVGQFAGQGVVLRSSVRSEAMAEAREKFRAWVKGGYRFTNVRLEVLELPD